MKQFKENMELTTRSICDHDCIFDGKEVNIYNDEGQTIEILPEGEYAIYFGKATTVFLECQEVKS